MYNAIFERCFSSEIFRVKSIVYETLDYLRLHVPLLTGEDLSDFKLILSELLYNAVIYGNKQDKNKLVSVRVELCDESIRCRIADEGNGFDYNALFESFKDSDVLKSDHGRGIMLAVALTEEFAFNAAGNEITFSKRIVIINESKKSKGAFNG